MTYIDDSSVTTDLDVEQHKRNRSSDGTQRTIWTSMDYLLFASIILPCTCGFTVSSWSLMRSPGSAFYRCSAVIGCTVHFLLNLDHEHIARQIVAQLSDHRPKLMIFCLCRTYIYLFSVASAWYWNVVWAGLDYLFGGFNETVCNLCMQIYFGICVLVSVKCLSTLDGNKGPSNDNDIDCVLNSTTKFGAQVRNSYFRYRKICFFFYFLYKIVTFHLAKLC